MDGQLSLPKTDDAETMRVLLGVTGTRRDEVNARCARVASGGEIVAEIAAPEGLNIFACMLGGADGRTLLMCAAPDFLEQSRTASHEAVLLTTTVDVPRAGLP